MDWNAVDGFLNDTLSNEPDWLSGVRSANAGAGLADIAVSPQQGAFLGLLVRLGGAKRILEVGTLGGYSTLWIADAAGEGATIVTLEADPDAAAQARGNFDASGIGERITLVEGDARETIAAVEGPLDMAFIDADKKSNPLYLRAACDLARSGALIVVDNIVREGRVIDPQYTDPNTRGARDVIAEAGVQDRLTPVGLQLVGSKGWDGMLLCLVEGR